MNIEYWKKKNDESFNKAIDIMADLVIEEFIDPDDIKNATDLNECDGYDIQLFYDIEYSPDIDEPFSIKEFNKEKKGHGGHHSPFEEFVRDNWEECLEESILEAVYDRIEVGRIVDKACYGGGGFEVMRDLELGVVKNVAEKLKNKKENVTA